MRNCRGEGDWKSLIEENVCRILPPPPQLFCFSSEHTYLEFDRPKRSLGGQGRRAGEKLNGGAVQRRLVMGNKTKQFLSR